jgi:hypothetical protein
MGLVRKLLDMGVLLAEVSMGSVQRDFFYAGMWLSL